MNEQIVTLRSSSPIVIETIHGVIELHRTFRDGEELRNGRKLRIVLPDGLIAKFGMDRIRNRPTWLKFDGEKQEPRYTTWTSVPTKDGFELRHIARISGTLRAVQI